MADSDNPLIIREDKLHPVRIRKFMSFLSMAADNAKERAEKKQKVKEHIETIKAVSLNKRTTKKEMEDHLGSFESTVKEIINDEEKILEEQRKETKQINDLKRMVEELSRKLIQIGKEYASELENKDRKIMELREALAAAHIKIADSGADRQKRIEDIEKKLKEKPTSIITAEDDAKRRLAAMESRLRTLEITHAKLKKKGKHSKKDLDKIKKLINAHRDKIRAVKNK
jgi:chromosome segregation ATPase